MKRENNFTKTLFNVIIIVVIFTFFSCDSKSTEKKARRVQQLSYAKGFSIEDFGTYKKLSIHSPYKNANKNYEYLLVPKGQVVPNHNESIAVINTPVERIIVSSSSHIPLLELLEVETTLVGFPNTDFISSPKTR